MSKKVECRYVQTRSGRIHIATAGEGFPLLLLHQTPRSWDEFRDVIPLLAEKYRVISMDTVGFGASEPLPYADNTIERWAVAAFDLLDALEVGNVAIAGHHTGAVIAHEMAASQPERVSALILSSCPFIDEAGRKAHDGKPVVDDVTRSSNGSHLTELWARRQQFYPEGDIDLLDRCVMDFLRAGNLAAEGHRVVWRYAMEKRTPLVKSSTLVLAATKDPHAYPNTQKVVNMIPGSQLIEIEGGMVPMPDQMPDAFAKAIDKFLSGITLKA